MTIPPLMLPTQGRRVKEWVGKTTDQKVPNYVRLRVLERHKRTCYLSKREIRPGDLWDLEHIRALSLGGEHRESNFAPALKAAHKIKTADDRAQKARSDSIKKKHYGLKAPSPFATARTGKYKQKLPSRRNPCGGVVLRDQERAR